MPIFDFYCPVCHTIEERTVDSSDRNDQTCDRCYHPLERKWSFEGAVWSPTKNGGYS